MPSCVCGVSSADDFATGSSAGAGSGMVAGCSAIASSASVDVETTVGVSCAGESTEPATGIVSDFVTGSSMTILLVDSVGCACGAHGADTVPSAAAAGTVSTLTVPLQNAQHSAEAARMVPAIIELLLCLSFLF